MLTITKKDEKADALAIATTKVELDHGLELWRVDVNDLLEQTLNARTMSPGMFEQLSENIKHRKGLESLPFCAVTEYGLEIVSGHHRVRAARKAGLSHIWCLVDVSGLSRDQIRAKQLAHNSIQGQDDPNILKAIFQEIEDAEARIEAYLDMPDLSGLVGISVPLTTADLDVTFDTKTIALAFLPLQLEAFKHAVNLLEKMGVDEVVLANRDEFEKFRKAMGAVTERLDIRSAPTILAKMSEIVLEHLDSLDGDHVSH